MNFRYLSSVGSPLQILKPTGEVPDVSFSSILARDYRGFYRRSESLGNFIFPQNAMIETHAQLYAQYGLYENRNGLMGLGNPFYIESFRYLGQSVAQVFSQTPVFVGDFSVSDPTKKVIFALGEYQQDLKIWEIRMVFGELPSPHRSVPEDTFARTLVDSISELKDTVITFVSGCKCPSTGAPLMVADAQAIFELKMNQIVQNLSELQR